jgi:hypothetical protein
MARTGFWNVWWTLTVISAALTLVIVALEALGVFRDLGVALSAASALLTLLFGLTASTRSSLSGFRGEVIPRLREIEGQLGGIEGRLAGIDGRFGGMEQRLDRIVTLLDERLPRPTP